MTYIRIGKWLVVSVLLLVVAAVGWILCPHLLEQKSAVAIRECGGTNEPAAKVALQPLKSAGVGAPTPNIQTPVEAEKEIPEGKADVSHAGMEEVQSLTDSRVTAKIQLACKALGIELQKNIRIEKTPPYNDGKIQARSTAWDSLVFDPTDGTLLTFLRFNINHNRPEGKAPLTAAEAAERLTEFVRTIGDPITVSEKDARPVDSDWHFTIRQEYKGVPVLDSRMHAQISKDNGDIVVYDNHPFRGGEVDITEHVGVTEGIGNAMAFLTKRMPRESAGWIPEPNTRKTIVYPNNFWTTAEEQGLRRADQPRCCWNVRIRSEQDDGLLLVFVDVETGEIVGGFGG